MFHKAPPIVGTLVVTLKILMCIQAAEIRNSDATPTNYSCPPWYFIDGEDKCSFSYKLPQIVMQYGNTSGLQIGFCMTVTNSSQVVSQCPYLPEKTHNISQYHSIYQMLPDQLDQVNKSFCDLFNRKGFLCSECKENYGLAVSRYYGLICVKCSSSAGKWIGFILLLFAPPTIFFLAFLILNINVHSGRFTGFIFFTHITAIFLFPAQIVLSQIFFGYWPIHILMALYGIWNLNFIPFMIPPFCVSTSISTLQFISLGYVSSVYPLVLCIITYYLIELHARGNWLLVKAWRPFHRLCFKCKRMSSVGSSIIHAFATFIFLSYGKNLFISLTLFQGYGLVELDTVTNTLKSLPSHSVYLGIPYFGATHAPYALLGLFGGVITIILPLVLVLIYPTRVFPKLIGCCGLRRWHMIRTFMEVFVGSYKDGTEGGRDYRLTAAVCLSGRIITAVGWSISGFKTNSTPVQNYSWLVSVVPYVLVAVVFALFKPHRKWSHNVVDALIFLLIAKMCVCYHIAFGTTTDEHTLRIMVLLLLIDFTIPQVALLIYCGIKLASWARLSDRVTMQLRNIVGGNHEVDEDNISQIQIMTSET